jgi:hypothetical protein
METTMAQMTCKFCGETLKANGAVRGPVLRAKENSHRRENHKAEMAPGIKFQRYASDRASFKMSNDWLTERDELEAFLADSTTLDHPTVRKMVEDKLGHAESFQARGRLIERVDDAVRAVSQSHREWLRWVRDENTFGFDELVRLVRIWNTDSFTDADERDLNELVMQHI